MIGLAVLGASIAAGTAGAGSVVGVGEDGVQIDIPDGGNLDQVQVLPQCSNVADDDGDGVQDMGDPDCTGPLDATESGTNGTTTPSTTTPSTSTTTPDGDSSTTTPGETSTTSRRRLDDDHGDDGGTVRPDRLRWRAATARSTAPASTSRAATTATETAETTTRPAAPAPR